MVNAVVDRPPVVGVGRLFRRYGNRWETTMAAPSALRRYAYSLCRCPRTFSGSDCVQPYVRVHTYTHYGPICVQLRRRRRRLNNVLAARDTCTVNYRDKELEKGFSPPPLPPVNSSQKIK